MSQNDYVGKTIDGRYKVLHLLGKGGMGAVYLARHALISKKVAIKFLHSQYAQRDEVLTRFYREAQAAAEIGHANIAEVSDMGVSENGEPYIVMEYLEGENLAELLARTGPMDLPAACGIIEQVLLALEAAHNKGIIHRDLKAENIFLVHKDEGNPIIKLIDFGVSKFVNVGDTNLTSDGALLGTPAYMSPEQIKGSQDVDQRTDLYAVGVILYQMLTGKMPFAGVHYHEILAAVLSTEPTLPSEVYEHFPIESEAFVMRCLCKDPNGRPSTARAMLGEMEQLHGYELRHQNLLNFISEFTSRTICSNDNDSYPGSIGGGSMSPGGTMVANDGIASAADYVQMVKQKGTMDSISQPNITPADWTGSGIEDKYKKSNWVRIAGIAGGVVTVAGIVLALVFFRPNPPDKNIESKSAGGEDKSGNVQENTQIQRNVQIEVRGIPDGAKIIYNKIPVPINPFRVEIKDSIVSLEIIADGYDPFITSVVPSEDQVVSVKLKIKGAKDAAPEVVDSDIETVDLKSSREDDDDAADDGEKSSKGKSKSSSSRRKGKSKHSSSKSKSSAEKDGKSVIEKKGVKFIDDFDIGTSSGSKKDKKTVNYKNKFE